MPKAAVIQLKASSNIAKNLLEVEKCMLALRGQVELVVLPENYAFMGMHEQDKLHIAEVEGKGPIQDRISQLAKQTGLWVVAGTQAIKAGENKVRASCFVYDNTGTKVARYDKIHLFDVRVSEQESHKESSTVEPGDDLVVVDTPVGKIGLTVCYDLRFPELYYQLMRKGAQVFTVPSAFTAVTGRAHWEVLLRARAIENLAYVLAPNQTGEHENGRHTHGHSMIIDPWGKIMAEKESGAGYVLAAIDLQALQQIRQQFPCINHHVLLN